MIDVRSEQVISFAGIRKTDHGTELTVFGSGNPLLHLGGRSGHQCVAETERKMPQIVDLWALCLNAIKQALLFFGHLVGTAGDEDRSMLGSDL